MVFGKILSWGNKSYKNSSLSVEGKKINISLDEQNEKEEVQETSLGESQNEIEKEKVQYKIQQNKILGSEKKKFPRPFIPTVNSVSGSFKGPGVAPTLIGGGANSNSGSGMIGSNERSMERFTLVNAWNAEALRPEWNGYKSGITPFRAATNSGDYLSRQDFTSGGSNQVQGRVNVAITPTANVLGGSIFKNLNPSGIPSATTNVKYVYDSSDYTTYLRQFATQKTYNDYSFGGSNNGSQEALSRARY